MNDEVKEMLDNVAYGLGVVDLSTKDGLGDVSIVHASFYATEPTQHDRDGLMKEVLEDKTFGLTEKADVLAIVDLPDYMLKAMLDDVKTGEAEVKRHGCHLCDGDNNV